MLDEFELRNSQVPDFKSFDLAGEEEARQWIKGLEDLYMTAWTQTPLLPSKALADSIKKLLINKSDEFLSLVMKIYRIQNEEWKKEFFSVMGKEFLLSLSKCKGKNLAGVLSCISDLTTKVDLILQLGEQNVLKIVNDQEDFVRIFGHLKLTNSNIDKDKVAKLAAIKDKALDKVFLKGAPASSEAMSTVLSDQKFHSAEKYNFLLCLLDNYERNLMARVVGYSSFWGRIFGYHKQAKLSGVDILRQVISNEKGETIPSGGVWSGGELGEIARAYCTYARDFRIANGMPPYSSNTLNL